MAYVQRLCNRILLFHLDIEDASCHAVIVTGLYPINHRYIEYLPVGWYIEFNLIFCGIIGGHWVQFTLLMFLNKGFSHKDDLFLLRSLLCKLVKKTTCRKGRFLCISVIISYDACLICFCCNWADKFKKKQKILKELNWSIAAIRYFF